MHTHCTSSAAFKISSAASRCPKAWFSPLVQTQNHSATVKNHECPCRKKLVTLYLSCADPVSGNSSDHTKKRKLYPKLSSPTICSGWNQCTSQTGSDCSKMTCISRRTQLQAGVNSSSDPPLVWCPHPQTLVSTWQGPHRGTSGMLAGKWNSSCLGLAWSRGVARLLHTAILLTPLGTPMPWWS